MTEPLRNKVVKLAQNQPWLRAFLVPLLRTADNVCSPHGTSYGWVSDSGEVFQLNGGYHDGWAIEHATKRLRITQQKANKLMDVKRSHPKRWGTSFLLWSGWIRVANAYGYMGQKGKVTPKAKKGALQILIQCLLRTRNADAEKMYVYVDTVSRTEIQSERLSAADILEKWGGRAWAEKNYWTPSMKKATRLLGTP